MSIRNESFGVKNPSFDCSGSEMCLSYLLDNENNEFLKEKSVIILYHCICLEHLSLFNEHVERYITLLKSITTILILIL